MKTTTLFFLLLSAAPVAAQSVATMTDFRLRRAAGAAGFFSFRQNGDGVIKAYNAAGVETSSWNAETGSFAGNGAGLTALNGSSIATGTVADARLTAQAQAAITNSHAQNTDTESAAQNFTFGPSFDVINNPVSLFFGDQSQSMFMAANDGYFSFSVPVEASSFSGGGFNLQNLNASNIDQGTLDDSFLSSNVGLLNGTQTHIGKKSFGPTTVGSSDYSGTDFAVTANHPSGVMTNLRTATIAAPTKPGAGTVTNAVGLYLPAVAAVGATKNLSLQVAGTAEFGGISNFTGATNSTNAVTIGASGFTKLYDDSGSFYILRNTTRFQGSGREMALTVGSGVTFTFGGFAATEHVNFTTSNNNAGFIFTANGTGATRLANSATNTLSFFGATAVARPAAYTQTYSTASRTVPAYTSDPESGVYGGIDNANAGDVYAQVSDLEALRIAFENERLRSDGTAAVLNQLLDDLQAYGLIQ